MRLSPACDRSTYFIHCKATKDERRSSGYFHCLRRDFRVNDHHLGHHCPLRRRVGRVPQFRGQLGHSHVHFLHPLPALRLGVRHSALLRPHLGSAPPHFLVLLPPPTQQHARRDGGSLESEPSFSICKRFFRSSKSCIIAKNAVVCRISAKGRVLHHLSGPVPRRRHRGRSFLQRTACFPLALPDRVAAPTPDLPPLQRTAAARRATATLSLANRQHA
mmetsp:Transcript_14935/g.20239  ORF Transcript_14935/g.20239 Transcript_14935/m.20239 type:complete len:218 (+) Transcript_14935:1075-1728(+)